MAFYKPETYLLPESYRRSKHYAILNTTQLTSKNQLRSSPSQEHRQIEQLHALTPNPSSHVSIGGQRTVAVLPDLNQVNGGRDHTLDMLISSMQHKAKRPNGSTAV